VDISNLDVTSTTFRSATFIDGAAPSGTLLKKSTSNNGGLVPANGSLNIYDRLQQAAWLVSFGNAAGTTGDQAAGVQLAVWNVLEDTDFQIGVGASAAGPEGRYFKASGFSDAARADADTYLASLQTSLAAGGGKASGYYLSTGNGQDVIAVGQGTQIITQVTPEGSSLLLAAGGMLPICIALLLRGRRARRLELGAATVL
jgi:hypothetical protein